MPSDTNFFSYRSRKLAQQSKFIQSVQFFDWNFSTALARWTYAFEYKFSQYSPAFYLSSYVKTFASGAMEPAVRFDYEMYDGFIGGISSKKVNSISALLAEVNAGAVNGSKLSFYDFDNDGLIDIEVAQSHKVFRQTTDGFVETADYDPKSDSQPCLGAETPQGSPRRIMRLSGPYGRPLVFMNLRTAKAGTTRLLACNLDGSVVYDETINQNFAEDATVAIGDLNGDFKPDLVRFSPGSLEFLENQSTGDAIRFVYRGKQALDGTNIETNISVADINGDGIPDLFMNEGSFARVLFGKGNFEFLKKAASFSYLKSTGQTYSIGDDASVSFVDANSDGLVDLAISRGKEFYLLVNQGLKFRALPIPFTSGLTNEGEALPFNIVGGGNPMVFRSSGSSDVYAMELSTPGMGLLKAVDDGQGNVVNFSYDYQKSDLSKLQLQKQLVAVDKYSTGKGRFHNNFEYGRSILNSQTPALLGFESVVQTTPLLRSLVKFFNPEEQPGLVASVADMDRVGSQVENVTATTYDAQTVRGIKTWLKQSEAVSYRNQQGAGPSILTRFGYEAGGICKTSEIKSLGADRAETVYRYVQKDALKESLTCILQRIERTGVHERSDFDFKEVVAISHNDLGQLLKVEAWNGNQNRLAQKVDYDELHRVAFIQDSTGESRAISYLGDSNIVDRLVSSIGTEERITERFPNGLIKTQSRLFGDGNQYDQSFEYDDYERLKTVRDNADPARVDILQAISYGFAGAQTPSFVEHTKFPAPNISAIAREYSTADGDSLGSSVGSMAQSYLVKLNSFNAGLGYQAVHNRAALTDDFLTNWQKYQAEAAIKDETYKDGFKKIRQQNFTHQTSIVEKISQNTDLEQNRIVDRHISNSRFESDIAYDAAGRVSGKRNEAGDWTFFRYDMAGHLREVELPGGIQHTATFDNFDQITKIDRQGLGSVTYAYNERGLMAQKTFIQSTGAVDRSLGFSYDVHGRLVKKVAEARGIKQVLSYYYDGFTSTPEFTAGQKGFLTFIKSDDFISKIRYDRKGRIVQATDEISRVGVRKTSTTSYYSDDSPKHVETSVEVAGHVEKTVWDYNLGFDGLLNEIKLNGQTLARLTYNKLGLLEKADFNNSLQSIKYQFDASTSQLLSYASTDLKHTASYAQSRDDRGRVVKEIYNGKERKNTFDERSFLTGSSDGDQVRGFSYDDKGLLRTAADERQGQVYDGFGRLVQTGSFSAEYNGDGQIASIRMRDGKQIAYVYDENGLRIAKTVDGALYGAWLDGLFISKEHVLEGVEVGGIFVGYLDNGVYQPLVADPRKTVFDALTGLNLSSAYGERKGQELWQKLVDFGGHPRDEHTGLVQMGVRDYDPAFGAFVQPDPLFLEDLEKCVESPVECNLYSYASNNPLNFVDPTGTKTTKDRIDKVGDAEVYYVYDDGKGDSKIDNSLSPLVVATGQDNTKKDQRKTAIKLAEKYGRPVIYVQNETLGWGGSLDTLKSIAIKVGWNTDQVDAFKMILTGEITGHNGKKGVRILAHSQGATMISEALSELSKNDKKGLKWVKYYGNASWTTPRFSPRTKFTNFVNLGDGVAMFFGSTSVWRSGKTIYYARMGHNLEKCYHIYEEPIQGGK